MSETTRRRDTRVAWVEDEVLEDLDYADDLALAMGGGTWKGAGGHWLPQ